MTTKFIWLAAIATMAIVLSGCAMNEKEAAAWQAAMTTAATQAAEASKTTINCPTGCTVTLGNEDAVAKAVAASKPMDRNSAIVGALNAPVLGYGIMGAAVYGITKAAVKGAGDVNVSGEGNVVDRSETTTLTNTDIGQDQITDNNKVVTGDGTLSDATATPTVVNQPTPTIVTQPDPVIVTTPDPVIVTQPPPVIVDPVIVQQQTVAPPP